MVRIGRLSWLAMVTSLVTSTADGQEPDKIGITMAYPAFFRILWQAGDKIAVRPTITLRDGSWTSTASSLA